MKQLKILLFDIETSPNLGYCWGKYRQDIISYKEQSKLLSFAYKWLGEKSVKVFCLDDFSGDRDKQLVKKLYDVINEAQIIVGHNGDRFDLKMSNAFFIRHGLPPTSPYKTVDTLKIARSKFRFNSNRLDDLGEYLGLGRKVKTGGFDLWLGCLNGDKKSWKLMKRYNKNDVVLLEKVYLLFRAWGAHPNINVRLGLKCPVCGSDKCQSRGWTINNVFRTKRYQCQQCGRWFGGEKEKKI